MVFARLRSDAQGGTEERSSQLGDEFFLRVAFITPLLAPEVPRKPRRVLRPVRHFMGESGVIALGIAEALERRHLDVIGFLRVVCAIAAVTDGGLASGEEAFGTLDAGRRIELAGGRQMMSGPGA